MRREYVAKRTGDSKVRVGLDFSSQVAGKALKHPGVIRKKAINLQTASDQDLVAWGLHSTDGCCILIPNNVWLRNTYINRGERITPINRGGYIDCEKTLRQTIRRMFQTA